MSCTSATLRFLPDRVAIFAADCLQQTHGLLGFFECWKMTNWGRNQMIGAELAS
jgi:hypothetical protein